MCPRRDKKPFKSVLRRNEVSCVRMGVTDTDSGTINVRARFGW